MFNKAVLRSFGGMERTEMRSVIGATFLKYCSQILQELVAGRPSDPVDELLRLAPPLELIRENLRDLPSDTGPGGRHLMVRLLTVPLSF